MFMNPTCNNINTHTHAWVFKIHIWTNGKRGRMDSEDNVTLVSELNYPMLSQFSQKQQGPSAEIRQSLYKDLSVFIV